jgi:hypothetical protein
VFSCPKATNKRPNRTAITPDADRRRFRLAQATPLVAQTATELSQRTPTGPRMAPVSPPSRSCHEAGPRASANDASPRWSRGFASQTDSGGALPACAPRELARLRFEEVCLLAFALALAL